MLYIPFAEVFPFCISWKYFKIFTTCVVHVLFSLFLDIYRFIPVLKSIYVKYCQLPAQHQWARSVWFFLLYDTVYHINQFPIFQLFTFLHKQLRLVLYFSWLKCCDFFAIFYCKFFHWYFQVISKWDWYLCFLCM